MLSRYRGLTSPRSPRPRYWTTANHASPAAVTTIATKKFSRSPRKYADESIRIVSSKIR
jgi:hypothetical protein